ncbi:MAG: hypothetical protein NTZ97_03110 [Candidatus Moranbacteria bacterium]|nr:hypothetical protein [Candidatus Moranbacteria bacterium]
MENFIKADIFFFITSIFVVILTIVLAIGAFYVIAILRDLKHISARAKVEGDELMEDIKNLRQNVKIQGAGLKSISRFFSSLFNKKKNNH